MSSAEYAGKVDKHIQRIIDSIRSLLAASKIADNDTADLLCLEIHLLSQCIIESVEQLLLLVDELKLSHILMQWERLDEIVEERIKKNNKQEIEDRNKVKRVCDEVRMLNHEIDMHLSLSQSRKKIKVSN